MGAIDPVLAGSELPGQAIGAATSAQQQPVDLAQQATGKRGPLHQPGQAMPQPGHLTGDLHHIVKGNAGC